MPHEPTEVMPLDELMDLAAEPSTAPTVQIRRTPPPTAAPAPAPTPAPAPLNPAAPKPTATAQPRVAVAPRFEPLLDQAHEFLGTADQWLRRGDNGLIVGTTLIALMLLLVVASL